MSKNIKQNNIISQAKSSDSNSLTIICIFVLQNMHILFISKLISYLNNCKTNIFKQVLKIYVIINLIN